MRRECASSVTQMKSVHTTGRSIEDQINRHESRVQAVKAKMLELGAALQAKIDSKEFSRVCGTVVEGRVSTISTSRLTMDKRLEALKASAYTQLATKVRRKPRGEGRLAGRGSVWVRVFLG